MNKKNLRLVLMALIGLLWVMPAHADGRLGLDQLLAAGEARVWYLGHCGYAVQTHSKLLIFDYVDNLSRRGMEPASPPAIRSVDNGWLDPREFRDLDVVVFVSHSHSDHYDKIVHEWATTVRRIRYIYGWEERRDEKHIPLPAPRATLDLEGLQVWTVNSQHDEVPEVSFLVKVDGLTIYHNGDYIGRMGGDEAPINVAQDMQYLQGHSGPVDLLFLGASATFQPFQQIIRALKPRALFPMHYGRQEEKYQAFARELKAQGFETPVVLPRQRGDCFHYRQGKAASLATDPPATGCAHFFCSDRRGTQDIWWVNAALVDGLHAAVFEDSHKKQLKEATNE